jgi:hypothetical protein
MSRSSLTAVIAALLGPALVLGAAFAALSHREPWTPTDRIVSMDKALARNPPVVALGSSLAKYDIQGPLLGDLLSDPPSRVAQIFEPSGQGPVFYAMLRYRILEAGHRPELVLVVSTLQGMLATRPESAVDLARLASHVPGSDEVIAARTLGGPAWLTHVRERRTVLHDRLMDGIKYAAVGLAFGAAGGAPAKGTADEALAEVFALDAMEGGEENRRVIPIVEVGRTDREEALDPRSTYLPDLVRIASESGVRLVFVRAPLAPTRAAEDRLPAATVRATIQLLNELGAGWVDMTDAAFAESEFTDFQHLNVQGRIRFTELLGARLQKIGALSDEPLTPAHLPTLPVRWERVGPAPEVAVLEAEVGRPPCGRTLLVPAWRFADDEAVAAAGLGAVTPLVVLEDGRSLRRRTRAADLQTCSGAYAHSGARLHFTPSAGGGEASFQADFDPSLPVEVSGIPAVWWVWPGTSIRFHGDDPWDPAAGALRVRAQAAMFGPVAVPAQVGMGDLWVDFVPNPDLARDPVTAHDQVADLSGPTPAGPWTLEIRSPPGGPLFAIRRLSFGDGDAEDVLIGGEAARPLPLTAAPSRYADVPLPAVTTGSLRVEDGVGVIPVPGTRALSDNRVLRETHAGSCSPLVVLEDGEPLPFPHTLLTTDPDRPGVFLHRDEEIFFRSSDGSDPSRNGRTYTVSWDPARSCGSRRWLLPGDSFVAPAKWSLLRGQLRPYRALLLAAAAVGPIDGAGPLHLVVRANGRTHLERDVPLADLSPGTIYPLDEPVPLGPRDLEAEVSLVAPAPPVIVLKLLLTESDEVGR